MNSWLLDNFWAHFAVFAIIILAFVIVGVMAFIYVERRGFGPFQLRRGPNRAGPFGILQPIADAIKVLLKEDIVPDRADKLLHVLGPVIVFLPALLVFAVIPFHGEIGGLIANMNVGIVYVVAISSLSVIGVFMAGWGSDNKYSLIAAMRVVGAMISYEIPLVLSLVAVVVVTGSLSMNGIATGHPVPLILLMPLGFLIFMAASMAEINRGPFDLLEADSELVAGFHIEYSGMKFAMFYLAEYGHALAMSAIAATVFLKGWVGPGDAYLGWFWFVLKTLMIFVVLVWLRVTFPRLRIDQMMSFAWKFLLPMALINLLVVGIQVVAFDTIPWWMMFINFGLAGALILGWSKFFRPGGARVEFQV